MRLPYNSDSPKGVYEEPVTEGEKQLMAINENTSFNNKTHRYFFVSDVHGEYNDMVRALNEAGFDKAVDTLVSLGDPFDRGPDSKKVLNYMLRCPHRILVWGNHDYRLSLLTYYQWLFREADRDNGVWQTIKSFDPDCTNHYDGLMALNENMMLRRYFNECVFGIRWSNLIAVHAWVPAGDIDKASLNDWSMAIWANTEDKIAQEEFPDRKMIFGHWHAWRLRLNAAYWADIKDIDFGIYETDKFIAIDGCTNLSHQVNVYVMETDEEPELIVPGLDRRAN